MTFGSNGISSQPPGLSPTSLRAAHGGLACTVGVSAHRHHDPAEGNCNSSLGLGPIDPATQVPDNTALAAERTPVLPGPLIANNPEGTWLFTPSFSGLSGGISFPVSTPAGQYALPVPQHVVPYKFHTQRLPGIDAQQHPLQSTCPQSTLPVISSATSPFTLPGQFLIHPPIQQEPSFSSGQPISSGHQNATYPLHHNLSDLTVQVPPPIAGFCNSSPPPTGLPPTVPSSNPHTAFPVNFPFVHSCPANAMLGRYVSVATTPDDRAVSGDLSDIEETIFAEEHPDAVSRNLTVLSVQERPFGSPSQNSSVVDLSYPSDHSACQTEPRDPPVRAIGSFVNLSLRDGQLYDETKWVDGTEEPRERKQRGQLTAEQREAARKARKWRACIRCHSQRVRVSCCIMPSWFLLYVAVC